MSQQLTLFDLSDAGQRPQTVAAQISIHKIGRGEWELEESGHFYPWRILHAPTQLYLPGSWTQQEAVELLNLLPYSLKESRGNKEKGKKYGDQDEGYPEIYKLLDEFVLERSWRKGWMKNPWEINAQNLPSSKIVEKVGDNILIMEGNIFSEDVEAVCNPVNCVGVMGAGLAKRFKEVLPPDFNRAYVLRCHSRHDPLKPGKLMVWHSGWQSPKYVVCVPTKIHYRDRSELEWVEQGYEAIADWMCQQDVRRIAIPALGCGLGHLSWKDVLPLAVEIFQKKLDPCALIKMYIPQ